MCIYIYRGIYIHIHRDISSYIHTYIYTFLSFDDSLILIYSFKDSLFVQHLKLAKRLKKIVNALGDLEKAGDALNILGESYFQLCNYEKAKKWHHKSFKVCERVQHGEVVNAALKSSFLHLYRCCEQGEFKWQSIGHKLYCNCIWH